jgi:hypothetical protein
MSATKPEDVQHSNFLPSATASGFGQTSSHSYDLSSEEDQYLTPKCVAEMTPRQIDHAAY